METEENKDHKILGDKPNVGEDLLEKYVIKEENKELHLNDYCQHYEEIQNEVNKQINPNSQNNPHQEDEELDIDGNPLENIYNEGMNNLGDENSFENPYLEELYESQEEKNEFAEILTELSDNLNENNTTQK